ncbi:hypothetical protein GOBAR_DD28756 [Gossypium barbadense]|nr:hypothetical protein GOBAR_DD28756 [Gossypium barbadense]
MFSRFKLHFQMFSRLQSGLDGSDFVADLTEAGIASMAMSGAVLLDKIGEQCSLFMPEKGITPPTDSEYKCNYPVAQNESDSEKELDNLFV